MDQLRHILDAYRYRESSRKYSHLSLIAAEKSIILRSYKLDGQTFELKCSFANQKYLLSAPGITFLKRKNNNYLFINNDKRLSLT